MDKSATILIDTEYELNGQLVALRRLKLISLPALPRKFPGKVILGLARFSNSIIEIVDLLYSLNKFGDGTRSGNLSF